MKNTEFINAKGLNPVKENSTTINAIANFESNKTSVYSVLMLWKKSGEKWKNKELVPVKISEQTNGAVNLEFDNGIKKIIDFNKN